MFLIKPFSGILGVSVLVFVAWVFLASTPGERIDRGCRPIGWMGNLLTSVFAVGAPSFSEAIHKGFRNTEYTCQYAIWRLFFEREWLEHEEQKRLEQERQRREEAQQRQNDASMAPGARKESNDVTKQGDRK